MCGLRAMAQIRVIQVDFTAEELAAGHHTALVGQAMGVQPVLPPAVAPMPQPPYANPYPEAWPAQAVAVPPTGPPPAPMPTAYAPAPVPRAARLWQTAMDNWIAVCLGVFTLAGGAVIVPMLRSPSPAPPMVPPAASTPVEAAPAPSPSPEDLPPLPDLQFPAVPKP
jgi:hypothetical protein